MKRRLNIIFFGVCFLAAIIAESFCLLNLKGDLFSAAGFGVVVLITGYLFMDAIRSLLRQQLDQVKFYIDQSSKEETQRQNEQYNEVLKLQKANYSATKKNSAMLTEQLKGIINRLEIMESSYNKELQIITTLQKKAMEGQKNALKMEIHYNKQNTKQIIDLLKEAENNSDLREQLTKVIELLELNNELIKINKGNANKTEVDQIHKAETSEVEDYNSDSLNIVDKPETNENITQQDEEESNAINQSFADILPDWEPEVSTGLEEQYPEEELTLNQSFTDILPDWEPEVSTSLEEQYPEEELTINQSIKDILPDWEPEASTNLAGQYSEEESEEYTMDNDINPDDEHGEYKDASEQTPEEVSEAQEISEAVEPIQITPIYDDPNKALSNEEIAALFATYGQ